ncbi:LpqB family beta-propeller domain-containing protein [Micromonospora sp. NPDC050397]|uniref:LpqB family beta-propeller domain-containing protein n=1 Tax=Micromonospora sp. NPDC050397 TaxID=3364279 RepID=UPI00384D9876
MNRPVMPAATMALLLCVGLAGCGIPAETEVRVDGRGPQSGLGTGLGSTPRLPLRTDTTDPAQFTANYLAAAAEGGEAAEVYNRVNGYIPDDDGGKLKPKAGGEPVINIVRLKGAPKSENISDANGWTVTIQVQQVGVLRADGSVGEPELTEESYVFTIREVTTTVGGTTQPLGGVWMIKPPPVLLLSTDALETYYNHRTIYFWNAARTTLVPDPRYLPKSLPRESQATEILGWLIGGPTPWLTSAVVPLPEGTSRIGNVPNPGDRLEVNLAVPATEVDDDTELDRLFTQLAWSLLPTDSDMPNGELELKIQSQRRKVEDVDDYRRDHPLYGISGSPKRFCVFGGVVYPLRVENEAIQAVPVDPEQNHDVHSAAFAGDPGHAEVALVISTGERFALRVATGAAPLSRFEQTRTFGTMDRPVWLYGSDLRPLIGLVVADGELYRFDDRAQLVKVVVPGVSGRISGVGAAPDGQRVAVVADNALYLAALNTDGPTVTVGRARRVATSVTPVTGVDWTGESTLAVAGSQPGRSSVIQTVRLDGAFEYPAEDTYGAVRHLSAYPDTPMHRVSPGLMFEANGVATAASLQIRKEQVSMPATSSNTSDRPSAPFFWY